VRKIAYRQRNLCARRLGLLTDVMALSGLATIEMAMADLNYPIELGSGV